MHQWNKKWYQMVMQEGLTDDMMLLQDIKKCHDFSEVIPDLE